MPFKEIDILIAELNQNAKWEIDWTPDAVGAEQHAIDEYKSIQSGRHELCQ